MTKQPKTAAKPLNYKSAGAMRVRKANQAVTAPRPTTNDMAKAFRELLDSRELLPPVEF